MLTMRRRQHRLGRGPRVTLVEVLTDRLGAGVEQVETAWHMEAEDTQILRAQQQSQMRGESKLHGLCSCLLAFGAQLTGQISTNDRCLAA
mmetsp:Transcript_55702/g.132809  ORF Transcript_55702/g.132809 Transcript_55702/m.132809 type:complete len:90 (+) Transcript_55702:242-511(+)